MSFFHSCMHAFIHSFAPTCSYEFMNEKKNIFFSVSLAIPCATALLTAVVSGTRSRSRCGGPMELTFHAGSGVGMPGPVSSRESIPPLRSHTHTRTHTLTACPQKSQLRGGRSKRDAFIVSAQQWSPKCDCTG